MPDNESNEQLVELVRAGDCDALLQLWEQVRRLVLKYAGRWAVYGGNGVEAEDLMQVGFIAVLRAAETFDSRSGNKFTSYLDPVLKTEFSIATGQRTRKQQMDPLQSAASLDAPLTDDTGDPFTLADTLEDPAAEAAFREVDELDRRERLYSILRAAVNALPRDQRTAIIEKYWRQERADSKAHAAALKRLRHPDVSRKLLAYM